MVQTPRASRRDQAPHARQRVTNAAKVDVSDLGAEEQFSSLHEARCDMHRRKIGLPQQKMTTAQPENSRSQQAELVDFVLSSFTMKECEQFHSHVKLTFEAQGEPCHCGETLENHHYFRQAGAQGSPESPRSTNSSPTRMVLTPRVTKQLLQQQKEMQRDAKQNSLQSVTTGFVKGKIHPESMMMGAMDEYTVKHSSTAALVPNAVLPPVLPNLGAGLHMNTLRVRPLITVQDASHTALDNTKQRPDARDPTKVDEWTEQTCIQEQKTNAFGEIEFANNESSAFVAKYLRVSDTTDVTLIMNFMINHWKMLEPQSANLVISIVGGAKNFRLDGRKREVFNRGLVKAAYSTQAWIITSGVYMGVMKAVGEAMQESVAYQFEARMAHSLRCIGIAPWGYVHNRESLTDDKYKGCWPAVYLADPTIRHGRPVSLDPNHSHFILVDDGYRNTFRAKQVADFRSKLEHLISAPSHGDGIERGFGIPVIMLLLEGGIDCFDSVYESVTKRVPVVVCQGTGRAADIIAYAYQHATTWGRLKKPGAMLSEYARETLLEKMEGAFSSTLAVTKEKRKKLFEEKLDKLSECCQDNSMMTVFDMNNSEDMDLAILSALLKAQGSSKMDQLKLALKWNRSDVAAEHIFTSCAVWNPGELDDMMTEALLTNKVEFVRMFLQHGVVMKDYLTLSRLRLLYIKAERGSHLRALLDQHADEPGMLSLRDVHGLIKRLLEQTADSAYDLDARGVPCGEYRRSSMHQAKEPDLLEVDEAQFEKPFKELFLWALLMNRREMAEFLWERGDCHVICAIAATKIFHSLAKLVSEYDTEKTAEYISHKSKFEQLAITIIDRAFLIDPEKALLIVERTYRNWGNVNCLYMGDSAEDKHFVSTTCCQTSINQTWKRGLNCSNNEIALAMICPLYVVFGLRYDNFSIGYDDDGKLNWFNKMQTFMSAPIVKFAYSTMWHIIFLVFFTYVILFDFRERIQILEIVLHCWVGTIAIELLRSVSSMYLDMKMGHMNFRKTSIWQKFTMIALVFHALAFALRWHQLTFEVARLALCASIISMYVCLFRAYMASSYLGPKMFVIRQMFTDVSMFLMILIVFMLSYAVSSQALTFPNRQFYWGIFTEILYYPYWQMFGELELDATVEGKMFGCNGTQMFSETDEPCPRKYWANTVLMAVYLLIGNVLMINLLIAIFSHVFEEVQSNSLVIWKSAMWSLVEEYENKPLLPPPFVIAEVMLRMLKWTLQGKKRRQIDDANIRLTDKQQESLQIFEKECLYEHLRMVRQAAANDTGRRILAMQEKLNALAKAFDDERKTYDHARIPQNHIASITSEFAKQMATPTKVIASEKQKEEHAEGLISALESKRTLPTSDVDATSTSVVSDSRVNRGQASELSEREIRKQKARQEFQNLQARLGQLEEINKENVDVIKQLKALLSKEGSTSQ